MIYDDLSDKIFTHILFLFFGNNMNLEICLRAGTPKIIIVRISILVYATSGQNNVLILVKMGVLLGIWLKPRSVYLQNDE